MPGRADVDFVPWVVARNLHVLQRCWLEHEAVIHDPDELFVDVRMVRRSDDLMLRIAKRHSCSVVADSFELLQFNAVSCVPCRSFTDYRERGFPDEVFLH